MPRAIIVVVLVLIPLRAWGEGTRVTGSARPGKRGESAAGVTVELRPVSLAWAPDQKRELSTRTRTTNTGKDGCFRFDGVEAGEYAVIASKPGWSPAEYRVHVSGTLRETSIGKELVLSPLASIDVAIQPPIDAQQRPWNVSLVRFVDGEQQEVAGAAASITGRWSHSGLKSGSYSVTISDAEGSYLAHESVYVDGATQYVPVTIEQVSVRGKLTMGDEAVQARIRFRTLEAKRVDLYSDEKGVFSGELPAEGEWDVEVTLLEAARQRLTLRNVDVRRSAVTGFADLDLELPQGRVHGIVVTADGTPLRANVDLFRDRSVVAGGSTDADGAFDFAGVQPGEIEIQARGSGFDSGAVKHSIRGLDDDPLRIVVAKLRDVRVRVSTPHGRPVAGARVSWVATNWVKDDATDPRGELRMKLPSSQTELTLGVVAIGYPLKQMTVIPADVIEVVLPPLGGQLFIAFEQRRLPYPMLGKDGAFMNLGAFMGGTAFLDGMPVRPVKDGFIADVEPGEYTVCMPFSRTQCETRVVQAGTREMIDATKWQE